LLSLVNNKLAGLYSKKNQKFTPISEPQFKIETRRLLYIVETEKSLLKNASMFFFYGQQARNRAEYWKSYFNANVKLSSNDER
jgi:hypothetical protein